LWHGANWTFIAWGVFHGSFLIIERLAGLNKGMTDQRLRWLLVGLLVVCLPARIHIGRDISRAQGRSASIIRLAAIALVGPIATMYALSSTFSPFLYFKF
jgi:hypothetical protein